MMISDAVLAFAAPGSNSVTNKMVDAICQLIGPLVGQHSQVLSIVFLIALGATLFMWWQNENKEGVLVWVLRTGLVLAVLINIFTLPPLIGLPSVC